MEDIFNNDSAGGFNSQTMGELQDLYKALEASSLTGNQSLNIENPGLGAALKVESLEKTLKVVTFTEKQLTLWKSFNKKPAFSTVEEFNQLTSVGSDRGGFTLEGELPEEDDSSYVRKAQLVKYLGTTRVVSHPAVMTSTIPANLIDLESKNGTSYLLRKAEKSLTMGNDLNIPQEFNGLYAQHQNQNEFLTLDNYYNSDLVIDMRGSILLEKHLEQASDAIVNRFGFGTDFFAPPSVLGSFVSNFYGNKFVPINTDAVSNGIVGQRVQRFEGQFGPVELNHSVFMNKEGKKKSNVPATSAKAPVAPVADATTPIAAVAVDAIGKWATADAGSYIYGVIAQNRFGESPMTILSATPTAIVSGGAVDLKFAGGASTNPATCYKIYRGTKGAASVALADFEYLFTVSVQQLASGYDGALAGVVRDRNRILPGTSQAFMIEKTPEIFEIAQLAPLMKMDLAMIGPAYRFMILLYATPLLYQPMKMVRFVNIGLTTP
jgi:hypothetical protein